jgi:hypothetical protein
VIHDEVSDRSLFNTRGLDTPLTCMVWWCGERQVCPSAAYQMSENDEHDLQRRVLQVRLIPTAERIVRSQTASETGLSTRILWYSKAIIYISIHTNTAGSSPKPSVHGTVAPPRPDISRMQCNASSSPAWPGRRAKCLCDCCRLELVAPV